MANYKIAKDFANGIITNQLIGAFPFQHLSQPLLLSWQIDQTADSTISGVRCLRARVHYGGRDYVAWFAPEIPIPDGPYVFNGLPGLITLVYDRAGWYRFELLRLDYAPGTVHWPTDYLNPFSKQIDRRTFVTKARELKNNPSLTGAVDLSEEQLLHLGRNRENRFDMLIEQ